jgi:hypothetical protein
MSKRYSSSIHIHCSISASTLPLVAWILYQVPGRCWVYTAACKCWLQFSCIVWLISSVAMNLHKKAQCMEWFIKSELDTQIVRCFRAVCCKRLCTWPLICSWCRQFKETRSIFTRKVQGIQWCPMKMTKVYMKCLSTIHISRTELQHESCRCCIWHCIRCYQNFQSECLQVASGAGYCTTW